MKASSFATLIGCVFSVNAMAQSASSSQQPATTLKQTAFMLGEASSMIPPKEPSAATSGAKVDAEKQTGLGPLILVRAVDGTVTIKHEGDASPAKEAQ